MALSQNFPPLLVLLVSRRAKGEQAQRTRRLLFFAPPRFQDVQTLGRHCPFFSSLSLPRGSYHRFYVLGLSCFTRALRPAALDDSSCTRIEKAKRPRPFAVLVPSLGSGHSFELCKACLQILALLALVALSRRGENVTVVLYVIRLLDGVVRDVGGVGRGTRARVCRPNRYMCVYRERERERECMHTQHMCTRGEGMRQGGWAYLACSAYCSWERGHPHCHGWDAPSSPMALVVFSHYTVRNTSCRCCCCPEEEVLRASPGMAAGSCRQVGRRQVGCSQADCSQVGCSQADYSQAECSQVDCSQADYSQADYSQADCSEVEKSTQKAVEQNQYLRLAQSSLVSFSFHLISPARRAGLRLRLG